MKCMQTNFGGCSLSGFGDIATFLLPSKMAKFSFWTMDYSPWGSKIELAQKVMQVEVDMKCMQTNLGGCSLFRDIANFLLSSKMAKFPFRTMDYSLWGLKNIEIYPIIFTKNIFHSSQQNSLKST